MAATVVRLYRDADRAEVIGALVGIQDHEVALTDTRLPGRQVAEPYFARLRGSVADHSGAMFIAEAEGRFAGFVACYVVEDDNLAETPDSSRFGYVSDIFVAPERRGCGIAQALLAVAERHLAATGVTRLRVGVLSANRTACRAYQSYGFAPYEAIYEKRIDPRAGARPGSSP
jgi:ribosomal protein S18 acetylase RimI-like enzyme